LGETERNICYKKKWFGSWWRARRGEFECFVYSEAISMKIGHVDVRISGRFKFLASQFEWTGALANKRKECWNTWLWITDEKVMNNSSDLCPTETPSLQDIDLSNNFLSSIPTALKGISALKKLSLSANLIQVI
jgi:hypothetical protein